MTFAATVVAVCAVPPALLATYHLWKLVRRRVREYVVSIGSDSKWARLLHRVFCL